MNHKRGFIAPALIAIIATLLIGGGVYVYTQNKQSTHATQSAESKIKWVTGSFVDYPDGVSVTPAAEGSWGGPTLTFPQSYFSGSAITSAQVSSHASCGSGGEPPTPNVTIEGIDFYKRSTANGVEYIQYSACTQFIDLSIASGNASDLNSAAYANLKTIFDEMVVSYAKKIKALPAITTSTTIASSSKHEAGSTYIYANKEYRIIDSIPNPRANGQLLIVAVVKSPMNYNTCGGMYDSGPCEFFVESVATNSAAQVKHIGTLDLKKLSFVPGSGHFSDAKTVEFTTTWGDAGESAQGAWRINIEKWAPAQIQTSQTADVKTYTNPQYGFSFQYPKDLLLSNSGNLFPGNKNVIVFNFPDSYSIPRSTISLTYGSGISFGVSSEGSSTCYYIGGAPPSGPSTPLAPIKMTINGNIFDKVGSHECGAGTCVSVLQYSIVKGNQCYRADLTIHEGNPGGGANAPTTRGGIDAVTAINSQVEAQLTTVFQQVLSTFKFTGQATSITLTGAVYNSVRVVNATTFLFADYNNKTWTVNYQNANFTEYSYTHARADGTNGLMPTTLQDWLKYQKHVGDPDDQAGAPGSILIVGPLNTDGVLVASLIQVNGQ